MTAMYEDGQFQIKINDNCENKSDANFFLLRDGDCVGGGNKKPDGTWTADVSAPHCSETDSDVSVLGSFDSQDAAMSALWDARWQVI